MSLPIFRAACLQCTSTADVDENFDNLSRLTAEAKKLGADLVTLPENFAFMGEERARLALAEPLPALGEREGGGKIFRFLSALARLHEVHIVASGMPEKGPDPDHTYNTALYVDADGALRAAYRKIHLFDVDLADGTALKESRSVAPGKEVVSVDTPFGRMGLAICYDVRFSELFRALSRQGVDFVVLGAAFTVHTGRDHWLTLLKARAIENQIHVIAPAQWGRHDQRRVSYGRSVIIDAWGTALCTAPDRACVVSAEIDLTTQARIRRELPALAHRVL